MRSSAERMQVGMDNRALIKVLAMLMWLQSALAAAICCLLMGSRRIVLAAVALGARLIRAFAQCIRNTEITRLPCGGIKFKAKHIVPLEIGGGRLFILHTNIAALHQEKYAKGKNFGDELVKNYPHASAEDREQIIARFYEGMGIRMFGALCYDNGWWEFHQETELAQVPCLMQFPDFASAERHAEKMKEPLPRWWPIVTAIAAIVLTISTAMSAVAAVVSMIRGG